MTTLPMIVPVSWILISVSPNIFQGDTLLNQALLPNFSRPLTDNEFAGWKPHEKLKGWYHPHLRLINTAYAFSGTDKKSSSVKSTYEIMEGKAQVLVTYSANSHGAVHVSFDLNTKASLPDLPKVGMSCGINNNFKWIKWYGKGPLEEMTVGVMMLLLWRNTRLGPGIIITLFGFYL